MGESKNPFQVSMSMLRLTPHPGDSARTDQKQAWIRSATRELAAADLFLTADTAKHSESERIVLQPLLPDLPPGDKDAQARLQYNRRIETENAEKILRREAIITRALNQVYNAVAQACEDSAPLLYQMLRENCDMALYDEPVEGCYFDGYRA